MDCSTPGFSVLTVSWSLLRFVSIELVMLSNHLIFCHPLLLPSIFPSISSFPVSWLFTSGGQCIGASALVLPMKIQDWFPLGLTGLSSLLSKGLSRVCSSTKVLKHQSSALHFLYGPTLTSVQDSWKNYGFDYMDLCWQSDVSAF